MKIEKCLLIVISVLSTVITLHKREKGLIVVNIPSFYCFIITNLCRGKDAHRHTHTLTDTYTHTHRDNGCCLQVGLEFHESNLWCILLWSFIMFVRIRSNVCSTPFVKTTAYSYSWNTLESLPQENLYIFCCLKKNSSRALSEKNKRIVWELTLEYY